jgi:ATP-binding cassette subfamily C protein
MGILSTRKPVSGPVWQGLAACRPHFIAAAAFSAIMNLLFLTPTIYMLQVYDRVVPTGGLTTLALLSLVALVSLGTMGVLDWLRSRLLVRISARIDRELAGPILSTVLSQPGLSRLERSQAMRQFDTLRQGLASPGVIAALDAPWAPIYILAAFLLHPALGVLTLVAGLVLLALAWSNERATHGLIHEASEAASLASAKQMHASSYAAEVRALGMCGALTVKQLADRCIVNELQTRASFAAGNHGGLIRFLRITLQSAALGLGGYLVVKGAVSPGSMIAASLLLSRALAPIEQIVGAWKTILQSREAYEKLHSLFADSGRSSYMHLPKPTGSIEVEHLTVLTPQNERVALADVSFRIQPGELVGIIGLSGAGKSTLLRTLAGAAQPTRGMVRFDGAAMRDWDPEQLARHLGYLPQDFILFPGSVKENISRFRGHLGESAEAIDAAVIEAARMIDAHDMIVRLPDGYDTLIGLGGVGLSAGQTQRVALARALFGSPRIVILDEPNAHLDAEAEYALMQTLTRLRERDVTVVLAAHSGDILASMDKLLLLNGGRIARFGPLAELSQARQPKSFERKER